MGRDKSHTSPFTSIANETRANPSLMLDAISEPLTPWGYSRTLPSGSDIFTFILLVELNYKINSGRKYAIFKSLKHVSIAIKV
jgi:hypothetical protein